MAILETKFLWDIQGKSLTGGIPEIIAAASIRFRASDFTLNSTTIEFLVDSVKVSEFILQSDYQVFMEARPSSIFGVPSSSFKNGANDLNKWVAVIDGFLGLPKAPQANFKGEIEKDDDEVTSKFTLKVGDIMLFDAKWNKDEDTLDFGSREAATVPWADFLNYIDAIDKFVEKVDLAKIE